MPLLSGQKRWKVNNRNSFLYSSQYMAFSRRSGKTFHFKTGALHPPSHLSFRTISNNDTTRCHTSIQPVKYFGRPHIRLLVWSESIKIHQIYSFRETAIPAIAQYLMESKNAWSKEHPRSTKRNATNGTILRIFLSSHNNSTKKKSPHPTDISQPHSIIYGHNRLCSPNH